MGGIRGNKDSQGKRVQTYSMEVRSMFIERRVKLTQSWKEERFGSLDHALLMCEMTHPYFIQVSAVGMLRSPEGKIREIEPQK